MLVKVICLNFESAYGGFNDEPIRDFIKDKEIISISDYLFVKNEVPYLALIIKYYPLRQESNSVAEPQARKDESWRQLLTEADMGLFNLLREWRGNRSRKEGLPPYILFTNNQLAQIVKARPQTLADLMKIDGVGKAKIEKYGHDILEITKIEVGAVT